MAQHERRQSEWPVVKRERIADFAVPDGYFRSSRPLTGPLRLGTAPNVGQRGGQLDGPASDMGLDRVSPRWFDPIGNTNRRAPEFPGSTLISRRRSDDR